MRHATRYMALLMVCLCACFPVWADVAPARILLGTSEAPLAPSPVFDGAGVLAPLQLIPLLGASYAASNDGADLVVGTADGQTGSIKTVSVDGTPMVPVDKLIALVGGTSRWDAAKRTLTLTAQLNSVEFDNDTLKINCSFPVHATARMMGDKIIVDVANAKVASEAKEVFIGAPSVSKARLGQFSDNTARVVLDLNKPTGCKLTTQGSASQLELKVGDGLVPDPAPAPQSSQPQAGKAQPFTIKSVTVDPVSDDSFNVLISTSGRATAGSELSVSPPAIKIDLPGGTLDPSCQVSGSHPLVQAELSKLANGSRLTLRMLRPMVYSVEVRDTETMVYVHPANHAGGTLADKVIVIDAGHGGNQKGAVAGGCSEKDINYKIAQQLCDALTNRGAKAIMARNGDEAKGLAARSEVAINTKADFFVSIHCNSNMKPDSASGIETYYHMQEPSAKLLACAVHDGVCEFTGACDRKARSDRSLYQSGLGVLRRLENTGIPGILVECGYVNNSSDRAKLLDSAYRAKLVNGIVAGLRAYVEGTPIQ